MYSLFFIVIASLFLFSVEVIRRRFKLQPSITRRLSHVGSALIAVVSPYFLTRELIIAICLTFAAIMYFSRKYAFLPSIHNVKRKTYGEVFLPLGEALVAAFFLPHNLPAFQFGILVMGLSDALAGFIGEKYGKHKIKILNHQKSLEGTLAFFVVTLILTFIFTPSITISLLIVPTILTILELALGYGTDNLFLPIVAAILLSKL